MWKASEEQGFVQAKTFRPWRRARDAGHNCVSRDVNERTETCQNVSYILNTVRCGWHVSAFSTRCAVVGMSQHAAAAIPPHPARSGRSDTDNRSFAVLGEELLRNCQRILRRLGREWLRLGSQVLPRLLDLRENCRVEDGLVDAAVGRGLEHLEEQRPSVSVVRLCDSRPALSSVCVQQDSKRKSSWGWP